MDSWTERLSEYIDGDLDATSAAALEQHLRGCAECSGIVADLRLIAAGAASLQATEPSKDLWQAIAAQIGAPVAQQDDARVISLDARRTSRRSITLSMPQLAAAAIILIALGGTAVWQMHPSTRANVVASNDAATSPSSASRPAEVQKSGDKGAPVITSRSPLRSVSTRQPEQVQTLGYDAAIQQLEQAASQNEAELDPKTKAVIDQSMATINRAIADARAALAADPANAYLHRHLDRTMKQKLELLRQAAKIDRGGA